MPQLPMAKEEMPASAGVVSHLPVTARSGGAIISLSFQALGQPSQFGGIRGGIIGISHFKPLY